LIGVGKIGFSANEQRELNLPTNSTQVQNERLRQIIKELQRHRFGRRT